jgi:hypothetical protein
MSKDYKKSSLGIPVESTGIGFTASGRNLVLAHQNGKHKKSIFVQSQQLLKSHRKLQAEIEEFINNTSPHFATAIHSLIIFKEIVSDRGASEVLELSQNEWSVIVSFLSNSGALSDLNEHQDYKIYRITKSFACYLQEKQKIDQSTTDLSTIEKKYCSYYGDFAHSIMHRFEKELASLIVRSEESNLHNTAELLLKNQEIEAARNLVSDLEFVMLFPQRINVKIKPPAPIKPPILIKLPTLTKLPIASEEDHSDTSKIGGRTGVFLDDESFLVEYEGTVIAYVLNASEGRDMLKNIEKQKKI